jgi:hypothetical protein
VSRERYELENKWREKIESFIFDKKGLNKLTDQKKKAIYYTNFARSTSK